MIGENQTKNEVEFLSVKKLKDKIARGENMVILDVRTRGEYEKGHIERSMLIYIDELRDNLDRLKRDKQIIIYCETGYRAYLGLRILNNMGFKDVKILNGSYLSWVIKI